MPDFMSPQRQRELIKMAGDVVDITRREKISPSDAMVKVARTHGLNLDEIDRIKEAYNTTAVLHLRKSASEPDNAYDMDAEVPLVDSEEVKTKLYPEPTDGKSDVEIVKPESHEEVPEMSKTAAEAGEVGKTKSDPIPKSDTSAGVVVEEAGTHKHTAEGPDKTEAMNKEGAALLRPESVNFNNTYDRTFAVRNNESGELPKFAAYGEDGVRTTMEVKLAHERTASEKVDYVEKQAFDLLTRLRSEHDDLADQCRQHQFKAQKVAQDLIDSLHLSSAPNFADIEKDALNFHDGMKVALDLIWRAGELGNLGHTRHAGDLPKYDVPTRAYQPYVEKIAAIRDEMGAHMRVNEQKQRANGQILAAEVGLQKCAALKQGGISAMAAAGFGRKMLDSLSDAVETKAPSAPPQEFKGLDEGLRRDMLHDRVRLQLGDLSNNDPTISTFPKEDVAVAFNELIGLQPLLAEQPIAMRAALRDYLTRDAALGLSDAKQLAEFADNKPRASLLQHSSLSAQSHPDIQSAPKPEKKDDK